jgi:DNA-binding ferritin-like protein (Dps family)
MEQYSSVYYLRFKGLKEYLKEAATSKWPASKIIEEIVDIKNAVRF